MASAVAVSLLQHIDEAERDDLAAFSRIIGNSLVDIPAGLLARDDRLALHALIANHLEHLQPEDRHKRE